MSLPYITRQQISQFDPATSEKMSPQLYRWLQKTFRRMPRIYAHIDSEGRIFLGENTNKKGTSCSGAYLTNIVNNRNGTIVCLVQLTDRGEGLRKTLGFKKCPEFWEDYLNTGFCALDKAHLWSNLNGVERWNETKRKRTCRFCGLVQVQRVQITRTKVWTKLF